MTSALILVYFCVLSDTMQSFSLAVILSVAGMALCADKIPVKKSSEPALNPLERALIELEQAYIKEVRRQKI